MLKSSEKSAAEPRSKAVDARRALLGSRGVGTAALDGSNKYLALVEAIEAGVQTGRLVAGAQLPARREIAGFFRTTVATVMKTISEALRRGLVVARAGGGTYIAPAGSVASQDANGLVDLSLNVPPISVTADIVAAALRRVAHTDISAALFDYAPVAGQLRNRLAGVDLLAMRGLKVDADQVTLTQGAHQGLITALMALTRPGDAVACERLNYAGLRRIAELLQLRLVGVDTDARVCRELGEMAGCPAIRVVSSGSQALARRGASRVALITPYNDDLTSAVAKAIATHTDVVCAHGMGITDNVALANPTPHDIVAFARDKLAGQTFDYLFVPCTNFRSYDARAMLEAVVGVPVVAASSGVIEALQLFARQPRARATA